MTSLRWLNDSIHGIKAITQRCGTATLWDFFYALQRLTKYLTQTLDPWHQILSIIGLYKLEKGITVAKSFKNI